MDVFRRGLVLSAILLAASPAPIHARTTISRSQEANIAACIRSCGLDTSSTIRNGKNVAIPKAAMRSIFTILYIVKCHR
jgi:hypothetical protein